MIGKLTRKLKLNYGLRYDLYNIPEANSSSPFSASQKFKVDKNNFAPRLGVVYGLREGDLPTVIRASAGFITIRFIWIFISGQSKITEVRHFLTLLLDPATSPAAPAFPNTSRIASAGRDFADSKY